MMAAAHNYACVICAVAVNRIGKRNGYTTLDNTQNQKYKKSDLHLSKIKWHICKYKLKPET